MTKQDAQLFREKAQWWRVEALMRPVGRNRAACQAISEGYTDLASLLEELQSGVSVPSKLG